MERELFEACVDGDYEKVKQLLTNPDIDVNYKNKYQLDGVKFLKDEFETMKPIQSKYLEDISKEKIKDKCGDKEDLFSIASYTSFDNVFAFKQKNGTYRCFSSDELKYMISKYDNKTKVIGLLGGTEPYEFGGDAIIAEFQRIIKEIEKKKVINKKYNRKINPYSMIE